MKNLYTYFEAKPLGGRLAKKTYTASAHTLGRVCVDVALITSDALVLVERSLEPAKGLWTSGGRIQWETFQNPYQYAAHVAKEHFGVSLSTQRMTLLTPRFICFKKRPYPEVLLWVVIAIPKKMLTQLASTSSEHSALYFFTTRKQLIEHLKKIDATPEHRGMLLSLWQEIQERGLLTSKKV